MLLYPTEMDIQLMKMLQEDSERSAFCHLGKGIDIFWETLAAVTELTIWTRYIGVGVVDVSG